MGVTYLGIVVLLRGGEIPAGLAAGYRRMRKNARSHGECRFVRGRCRELSGFRGQLVDGASGRHGVTAAVSYHWRACVCVCARLHRPVYVSVIVIGAHTRFCE